MISQIIPTGARQPGSGQPTGPDNSWSLIRPTIRLARRVEEYGPVCRELHVAARRERAGVDSGGVPSGAVPRRIRGVVLLSESQPARDRCRGPGVARGHRAVDSALCAVLGTAGGIASRALWSER